MDGVRLNTILRHVPWFLCIWRHRAAPKGTVGMKTKAVRLLTHVGASCMRSLGRDIQDRRHKKILLDLGAHHWAVPIVTRLKSLGIQSAIRHRQ